MFKIKYIKEHVEELIKRNQFDLALNHIQVIQQKYDLAIVLNEIPIGKSFAYQHVQEYWKEEAELARNGEAYPDGSKERMTYELKQLKEKATRFKEKFEKPPTISEQTKINSLDDILINPEYCFKILMETEPPIIGRDFTFLFDSQKKAVIVAWLHVLKEKGYFLKYPKDPELALLLNKKFPNLNLGKNGRTIRKKEQHCYHDYLPIFKSRIPKTQIT